MKLDLRENKGIAILEISGEITAGGGDQVLREAVDTVLGSGRNQILLDLSNVEFMDSAGIGELVASFRTVERLAGHLKILNAPPKVYNSLTIAKLLPIFEIYDDEEEAVASFKKAKARGKKRD